MIPLLDAFRLTAVTARWRYTARDGTSTLRLFAAWAREQRSGAWANLTDSNDNIRFDGPTAPGLIALAHQWPGR